MWGIPELHVHARIGSTNDLARAAATAVPAGTTFIADAQSAGRGQHGRHWESPPGASLLMSVVLRARAQDRALGAAPLRVGLAVVEAIEQVSGAQAAIKWPNDVLLDGRKVAGVLCEGIVAADGAIVIAGIGVNVHQEPADFSAEVRGSATSLRIATGAGTARSALAGAILHALHAGVADIGEPLRAVELRAFAVRDALQGRTITIDGRLAGTAAGITAEGELRVQHEGAVRHVHGGTVRVADGQAAAHQRTR